MKAKFEEIETNSKIKIIMDLYRSMNEIKNGYQSRTNIVKDEKVFCWVEEPILPTIECT